jgi:hypothetical protein
VQSNARFSLRMIRPFGGFAGMTYAEFFGRPEPYNSAFQLSKKKLVTDGKTLL